MNLRKRWPNRFSSGVQKIFWIQGLSQKEHWTWNFRDRFQAFLFLFWVLCLQNFKTFGHLTMWSKYNLILISFNFIITLTYMNYAIIRYPTNLGWKKKSDLNLKHNILHPQNLTQNPKNLLFFFWIGSV